MKVMKFGGTSLANWSRFEQVLKLVNDSAQHQPVAVVLSAPASVTNSLIDMLQLATQNIEYKTKLHQVDGLFEQLFTAAWQNNALDDEQFEKLQSLLSKQIKHWDNLLAGVNLLSVCPDKIHAEIVTAGESLSAALMLEILLAQKISAGFLAPAKLFCATGDVLAAVVDIAASKAKFASQDLSQKQVWVMPGFTAGDLEQNPVCLGRNGSDYSAAVLAACINASVCEIWTDVDGIYNADPQFVVEPKLLPQLSYAEAMELSYFGAKVLHPKTIAPIAQFHIPCYIKNTLNSKAEGTLVSSEPDQTGLQVKAISNLDEQTMFDVSGPGMKGMVGMASRVFDAISRVGISVSLITQSSSQYSISFCVASTDAKKVKMSLEQEFELELKSELLEPFKMSQQLAIVSLIGDGMRTSKGVAAGFFQALAQAGVNIIALAQGSSERSISAVVLQDKVPQAVRACHRRFFDEQRYLDLFLVGCGNVGTGLLEQIRSQEAALKQQHISIRVCGIVNSQKMLLDARGIDLTNWQNELAQSSQAADLTQMAKFVRSQQLLNPVMLDCTASGLVADAYLDMFKAGMHVVTPNKKANTREYAYYQKLREVALKYKRLFLYEATVGAGLPVIDNLKKLLMSGDKLHRFKGILSGSLSFIFGMLDEGMSLSKATQIAKDKCFTEPDPRDDLSGMDVARKVLILAREAGMQLELEDVQIEPILPPDFDDSGDIDTFMNKLTKADQHMAEKVRQAKENGKLLRYVGQIDQQGGRVVIAEVDKSDPLYSVKGGENALAFYSRYYQPIPFVLRGYGAGTEVTAAGTFADVLRALNWDREVEL